MPSDSQNLRPEKKKRVLDALTANPTATKDSDAVYRELNTQTNNTTDNDKHRIDRTNIG